MRACVRCGYNWDTMHGQLTPSPAPYWQLVLGILRNRGDRERVAHGRCSPPPDPSCGPEPLTCQPRHQHDLEPIADPCISRSITLCVLGPYWTPPAPTHALTSLVGPAGNKQAILAPQQIVSCDKSDDGCDGGDTPTAYKYVKKAGGMVRRPQSISQPDRHPPVPLDRLSSSGHRVHLPLQVGQGQDWQVQEGGPLPHRCQGRSTSPPPCQGRST